MRKILNEEKWMNFSGPVELYRQLLEKEEGGRRLCKCLRQTQERGLRADLQECCAMADLMNQGLAVPKNADAIIVIIMAKPEPQGMMLNRIIDAVEKKQSETMAKVPEYWD